MQIDSAAIRRAMLKLGMGTQELADKTGLSQPTITKVTYNDKPCTIRTIGRLALALKVDPESIIKSV